MGNLISMGRSRVEDPGEKVMENLETGSVSRDGSGAIMNFRKEI
jgi:hypothetical protein